MSAKRERLNERLRGMWAGLFLNLAGCIVINVCIAKSRWDALALAIPCAVAGALLLLGGRFLPPPPDEYAPPLPRPRKPTEF